MAYLTKDEIYEIKRNNDLDRMKYYCDMDETNYFIHLEYARMLIHNNVYPEAKEELKALLDTRYETAARYEFGVLAYLQKNYDLAREHFKYVEKNTGFSSERDKAKFALGKLEYEAKNYEASEAYFNELLGTLFDTDVKFQLAKTYYVLGKYKEAKALLKELFNTRYAAPALYELGKTEYALRNVENARYYFKQVSQGNSKATYKLGELEYNEGNYKDAEKYFESCKYAGLYLPKTKYLLGKTEEAINGFKSLLNTKDDYYSALFLAIIFIKERRYEEAFDVINKHMAKYGTVDDGVKLKIALMLFKELGVFFYKEYPRMTNLPYSDRQTINYDETRTLSHINVNHVNVEGKSEFREGINLYDLLTEVKEKLTEDNKTPTLNLNDMYHINYPNIGKNGESLLRIITTAGTKDIITMFPVFNSRDEVNESDEEQDYNTRIDMLLSKITSLYQLSKTNDFEFADAFSDSEKQLISELFDIKTKKKTK